MARFSSSWIRHALLGVACFSVWPGCAVWAAEFRTTREQVIVYESPYIKSRRLSILSSDYPVEILDRDERKWLKIRDMSGDIGWIEEHSTNDRKRVIVRNNSAEVLRYPDMNSRLAFRAEKGVILERLSAPNEDGWVRVRIPNTRQEGHVKASQIWGVDRRKVVAKRAEPKELDRYDSKREILEEMERDKERERPIVVVARSAHDQDYDERDRKSSLSSRYAEDDLKSEDKRERYQYANYAEDLEERDRPYSRESRELERRSSPYSAKVAKAERYEDEEPLRRIERRPLPSKVATPKEAYSSPSRRYRDDDIRYRDEPLHVPAIRHSTQLASLKQPEKRAARYRESQFERETSWSPADERDYEPRYKPVRRTVAQQEAVLRRQEALRRKELAEERRKEVVRRRQRELLALRRAEERREEERRLEERERLRQRRLRAEQLARQKDQEDEYKRPMVYSSRTHSARVRQEDWDRGYTDNDRSDYYNAKPPRVHN